MKIRLGISTCPNDIFAFHAILNRRIGLRGIDFDFALLDVQELNDGLRLGAFDAAKGSFHAALRLSREYGVLGAGSALGFAVGPLMLAREGGARPGPDSRILCPGAWTTAALLLRCFYPECRRVEHVVFSDIMPLLAAGKADFGVVIHEGRFTYERAGLSMIEDFGERWENETSAPLPLGGILARLDLPEPTWRAVNDLIGESIDYAQAHRSEALETMRRHARELEDDVIWSHVGLYVNDDTRALGAEAERALGVLHARAAQCGAIPPDQPAPKILR